MNPFQFREALLTLAPSRCAPVPIASLVVFMTVAACGGDRSDINVDAAPDTPQHDASDIGDVGDDFDGHPTDDATDVEDEHDLADDASDARDSDLEIDSGDDAEIDTDVEPLSTPFVPAPFESPVVDEPFIQEWNHTTPEVDPRVGALVDVAVAPARFIGWAEPTQVTASAVLRGAGEDLDWVALPDGEGGAIAAAVSTELLVVAASDRLWSVDSDGTVEQYEAPDGVVIERLVDGRGGVWALTSDGLAHLDDALEIVWPSGGPRVVALAEDEHGIVVGTESGLARYRDHAALLVGDSEWEMIAALDPGIEAIVLDVVLPDPIDVITFHRDGVGALRETATGGPTALDIELFRPDRVPLRGAVEARRTGDGGFIAVGNEGAWRLMDRGDGPEWRVYPAERWLPSQDVRGVATPAVDALSPLYFATAAGLARVTAEWMTLEQKLEHFVERVVLRHDRDGAVADSHLTRRGDLSSNIPWDSDNDGGWTCYWLLAECARWEVTGAEDARANFDKSLDRMLSLQTLTGTDHFLARAVIRIDGCQLDDCDDPDDGEWFVSSDGEWWVKANTSNDEVISHMFMMGPAYDRCATDDQKAAIRQHVTRIVRGIVENGWQLVDLDGEVTRYGQFDPGYINVNIGGRTSDGGRRSVAMLGMLALAWHVSGDEWFLEARRELIDEHQYAENARLEAEYPLRWGQYSGDNAELSMQAWMALLRYEPVAELRAMWFEGWSRSYARLVLQQGAMWDVANYMLGGETTEIDAIMRWLRLAPMDFIRWNVHNAHRRDLVPPPDVYDQRGRMRSDGRIVPYDERANDRWNTDQFKVGGGFDGWIEMDGADVLAPYWLARMHGLIVPAD